MKLAILILFIFVGAKGRAQEPSACQAELEKFCAGEKDPKAQLKCLFTHHAEISAPCKSEMQRRGQAAGQAAARGGGALSAFGGMSFLSPPVTLLSYEGRYSPDSSTSPAMSENKVNLGTPVFKNDVESLAASFAWGKVHFSDAVTLNSGTVVAKDFYRTEVGSQYSHKLAEGRTFGIRGSVGYAGDRSDDGEYKDLSYGLVGTYGYPGSDKGYWILMVTMGNNNAIANFVPIPGFLYIYRTDNFTGMFGFPIVAMQWTPVYPWSFALSLFGPIVNVEAAYEVVDQTQVFAAFKWDQQNYIPDQRNDTKDRLTITEKKSLIGLRTPIYGSIRGELQFGQSFDRSIYIGHGFLNKSGGSAALDTEWAASWSIKAAF